MMSDEPIRLAASNTDAIFDGMTWPTAGKANGELEWRLRHAPETLLAEDLMSAASVLAAYQELVCCPETKRRAVVRRLREAAKMEAKGS